MSQILDSASKHASLHVEKEVPGWFMASGAVTDGS